MALHGLQTLLRVRPLGALLVALVSTAFAAAMAVAGLQLWRLTETGRVASAVVLAVVVVLSSAELHFRGRPYIAVRLVLDIAALAVLLSRRARDVCRLSPSPWPDRSSARERPGRSPWPQALARNREWCGRRMGIYRPECGSAGRGSPGAR